MIQTSPSRNQAGFTLMEVMIAITLLSFIMVSIIVIQNNSQDSKIRIVKEDRHFLQVETAFSRIKWDISHTYSPLYFSHELRVDDLSSTIEKRGFQQINSLYTTNDRFGFVSYDGYPVPIFQNPEKNELIFFTSGNRRKFKNSKQSIQAWVRYSIVSDDSDLAVAPSDKLIRQVVTHDLYNPQRIEWDNVKAQTILRNVVDFKFLFWSPLKRKWVDKLELVNNGRHVIRGVKIQLKWLDIDETEVVFERVYRPLFPLFEPENMYELRRPTNNQAGRLDNRAGNINGANNQGDEDEDE